MSTPSAEDVNGRDAADAGGEQEQSERAKQIDAEPALSPAAEQGAAALSQIGGRKSSELFSDKPVVD